MSGSSAPQPHRHACKAAPLPWQGAVIRKLDSRLGALPEAEGVPEWWRDLYEVRLGFYLVMH